MYLLKIFSLLITFIFISCSNIKTNKPNYNPVQLESIPKSKNDIKLLRHQMLPVDYLQKNPHIKGLIVNHYMGTGKTLLGIAIAESFPSNPVIIIAPRFLESQWVNEISKFGVKDTSRYQFISYNDSPKKLATTDLSNSIILADEVHNLIKNMHTSDPYQNSLYTDLYSKLRKAYKIIGLTGTPILNNDSDIAYLVNLVSHKELMPFNQETFRLEYTKINPTKQFIRGYLTESNFVTSVFPNVLGLFAASLTFALSQDLTYAAAAMGAGILGGIFTPVVINNLYDLNSYKLREIDAHKMAPIFNDYISFFKFDEASFKEFPALDYRIKDIAYNRPQYSFFLHLVEGDLPVAELQRLLKNEPIKKTDEFVKINSTALHEQINNVIGSGRDIGNFDFIDKNGLRIEPPKFVNILEDIKKHNEQTVIYSNFYQTGTLAFAEFLKRQNYDQPFATLTPDLSVEEVNNIVAQYNEEKIKILLLHPEITEGISLKGTQHMHILEPMLNSTVMEQVIGRARRFQSHTHLPKDKQTVHVNMWKSTSSNWDFNIGDIKRENWYKRYRELNYLSRWGIGIIQVDHKVEQKALNPDELSLLKLQTLSENLKEIQSVLSKYSIESKY